MATYYRVVNSNYARYQRAAGATANFAIPVYGRANFIFGMNQNLMTKAGNAFDGMAKGAQEFKGGMADAFNSVNPMSTQVPFAPGTAHWKGIGDAAAGAKDMVMNGEIDPAEMAAAAAAGLGATLAGVLAWRKRMGGAAPAVEGVRQTMGLGKKLAIGGGAAAGVGALGYGASRMGNDNQNQGY